jgi:hypothetical protein
MEINFWMIIYCLGERRPESDKKEVNTENLNFY